MDMSRFVRWFRRVLYWREYDRMIPTQGQGPSAGDKPYSGTPTAETPAPEEPIERPDPDLR